MAVQGAMKVPVLCIANMHLFELDEAVSGVSCPECGCRYVRRYVPRAEDGVVEANSAEEVNVTVMQGKHRLPVVSWLSDNKEFVKLAKREHPEAGSDDIKTWLERRT